MSNPFFDRNPYFKQGKGAYQPSVTPAGYPTMPGYNRGLGTTQVSSDGARAPHGQGQVGDDQASAEQLRQLEQQWQAPSALNVEMERMTYDDVIVRAGSMLAIIVAAGAVSWFLTTSANTGMQSVGFLLFMMGAFGGLILGIVNSLRREPSPVLIMIYSVFEGAMIGGFSGVMERSYPGVVLQAVMATVVTFGVVLVGYKSGILRLGQRGRTVLLSVMAGYALFSILNFGLMLTGVVTNPWGLRGATIFGFPLGLILGIAAVIMAALSLSLDFESIERGVKRGLPRKYAWSAAFGLVVTLVWLYLEFLRILAILNRR